MREMDARRARRGRLARSAPAKRGLPPRHDGCQCVACREARRGDDMRVDDPGASTSWRPGM